VSAPLAADGRIVVVAVDHPLYSWPCAGLEDRAGTIRTVVEAGADAIIAAYGTVRDVPEAIGAAAPILKLDVTTVTVGGDYPLTEYVTAYSVDDAQRVGAAAVLTFVQLGADFELDALRTAGQVAAAADRAGLPYVCEIMPVESLRFPDPYDPGAIAAATRTAVELGAHVVKTSMPTPAEAVADAAAFGVPVILAGGDLTSDRDRLLGAVDVAMRSGASGVAFGRNVWGAADPAGTVRELARIVHAR
jgi:2-amino-4,5-dihydroxy-6-oxo-7-(phosphonooxy)heptanoate synthase